MSNHSLNAEGHKYIRMAVSIEKGTLDRQNCIVLFTIKQNCIVLFTVTLGFQNCIVLCTVPLGFQNCIVLFTVPLGFQIDRIVSCYLQNTQLQGFSDFKSYFFLYNNIKSISYCYVKFNIRFFGTGKPVRIFFELLCQDISLLHCQDIFIVQENRSG